MKMLKSPVLLLPRQPSGAQWISRKKFLPGTHLLRLGRERQVWIKCLVLGYTHRVGFEPMTVWLQVESKNPLYYLVMIDYRGRFLREKKITGQSVICCPLWLSRLVCEKCNEWRWILLFKPAYIALLRAIKKNTVYRPTLTYLEGSNNLLYFHT